MTRVVVLTALLAVVCGTDALKLPSYIKPCRKDDPNLNECALKNGREAVSSFVNGDKKYKIPNLNPLTLYNFRVDNGNRAVGIDLLFKEAHVYGLSDGIVKSVNIQLGPRKFDLELLFPTFNITGDYDISGRVLVLPISGKGPANITVTSLDVTVSFDYDLITMKKDGKEHLVIKNTAVKFTAGRAYIHLENLFNGDKLLGDNMNRLLNENWREVIKELGPSVADAIGEVIRQIMQQISDLVPYENIFLV